MKHLKLYENYTNTNTSHNVDFVYNAQEKDPNAFKPSKIVEDTIQYLEDTYNTINSIDKIESNYPSITFSGNIRNQPIKQIRLNWDKYIPKLSFTVNKNDKPVKGPEYQKYSITIEEYKYLKNFFIQLSLRKQNDQSKKDNTIDKIIDPVTRDAEKYNL